MGRRRQMRKREEIREKILSVARDIISKEGIQGLSIRKIAGTIDYSPGIIYHYFKDKNEIVEAAVSEGYKRILHYASGVQPNEQQPEKEIREVFTKYIEAALASPKEYMAFMLSDHPSVAGKTAVLQKGISQNSRTMQMLCSNIQRGIGQGRFAAYDPELTAQIIWASTFGLIIKLIIEKNISREQKDRLIDHHFRVLFNGIMKREEV